MLADLQKVQSNLVEISSFSSAYPTEWKDLPVFPEKLYALGDVSLLQLRKFAVVGSRRTPANALQLGREICKELSEHFVLVTGTADGGDSAAIEGALSGSGRIICVLAGGFSALPQGNLRLLERVAERGLLLSPCSFETAVFPYSYEYRNKLLAKLSEGVLVLGAGEKSGALITAKYAKMYQKPIFAFPYPANAASGAGCNALIKKGGYLTENATDVLSHFDIEAKGKKEISLSADEAKVYEVLQNKLSAHVAEIAEAVHIPVYKIRGVLSALEVKGVIVAMGGNTYAIV